MSIYPFDFYTVGCVKCGLLVDNSKVIHSLTRFSYFTRLNLQKVSFIDNDRIAFSNDILL